MADDVKISETLEFLTQIHTAWDNSEQRASLRLRPRRTISYDYIGQETWHSQYLRTMVYTQQTQLLQIPLWHTAYTLYDQLYASQANFQLGVDNIWQYRGCSGAIIWKDDDYGANYYPVTELASTGMISFGKQLIDDMPGGSGVICPVAWGCLSQSNSYINYTGSLTSLNLTFETMRESQAPAFPVALDEYHNELEDKIYGTDAPQTFNGQELFLKPPTWGSDMNANFTRNANRLDNSSGSFVYDLKSKDPTETREIEYIMENRVEINNMQRFFTRCRGRRHSFYAPTWTHDIQQVGDYSAGARFILTKFTYYWKYYATTKRRRKAIVFYKDRTMQIISIAGYGADSTGEYGKIYLESVLTKDMKEKDVLMICFLCLYRFGSDTMTISYDTVEVANTTLSITEVDA